MRGNHLNAQGQTLLPKTERHLRDRKAQHIANEGVDNILVLVDRLMVEVCIVCTRW